MKKVFLFSVALCAAAPAFSFDAAALREKLAAATAVKDAQISVYAKYLDGETIVDINKDLRLTPASTLKLYTTAAALDYLGPDFIFKTQVYLDGRKKGSTLKGDLYVKGGGDPSLGSLLIECTPSLEQLAQGWIEQLKALGVKRIKGNIYADNSLFSGVLLPWKTMFQNIGSAYAAPADALSARDNAYEIYFEPSAGGGEAVKVSYMDPQINGLRVISRVRSLETPDDYRIFVNLVPGQNAVEVLGDITASPRSLEVAAAIPSPALFFAQYLETKFKEARVKVSGQAALKAPDSYEGKELLITHSSPPLGEIVKYTNKRSINLYADVLLRAISAYKGGPGTAQDGVLKMKEFLARLEAPADNFDVYDGSGLSRDNITACSGTVALLENVLKQPYGRVFYDSLPIAGDPGDTGTMRNRLLHGASAHTARVKTGSLDRVRAHAGYTKDNSGKEIVFCIVTNNYNGPAEETAALHEEIMDGLASIGLNKKPGKRPPVKRK
ncbi:MAG: D-alanyl-D-alanine carboxypeptidase/D-alanyl-D-alanine-endopeptidase [Elusimicrobiota bacterium]|jgi:D-alanyl-D-alanine carboxypeptidase/D-alanyl-D-alanine-endopeptidase (penicillin-binding protein 4)|nr:D-alanyl-D-alanine carboxypeptidase/D-alanyl-D-alanine-endopeptidase [Elusimicrobiota bacterium]